MKKRNTNRKRKLQLKVLAPVMFFLIVLGFCACGDSQAQTDDFYLAGKGTLDEPYLIKSVNDLEWLSLQVNSGTEFQGMYFQQTNDLDFSEYGNWTPIGAYGTSHYFLGIYDGKGHSIQNITIDGNELSHPNVGLFGILGGTVCNLKIESGEINGACVGSIASHGGDTAVIANCYNQATLTGSDRTGGIADNLANGKIISCANSGELICDSEERIGGISSYSAGEVYSCYSTENPTSEVFSGQVYRTNKVNDVYPGIADGDLERMQELFADDLKGVKLVNLGMKKDNKEKENNDTSR